MIRTTRQASRLLALSLLVLLASAACGEDRDEDEADLTCAASRACWRDCAVIHVGCEAPCPDDATASRPASCDEVDADAVDDADVDDGVDVADVDDDDADPGDAITPPDASGPVACEGSAACAISGSSDCATIGACSGDLDEAGCSACQGLACGQDSACDAEYPCVDGQIVLRGCCEDSDCEGLTPFCGRFIGTNNVCVNDDDI